MARNGRFLERVAYRATAWTGSSWAFALALGVLLVWGVTGPLFGFSDTWQLVINTGTTIVTFLMVFLIQRSQNKDAQALHLKLNELVAAVRGASNRLINVEDFSEADVRALHAHYEKLVELAKQEGELTESHSIEEAEGRHRSKGGPSRPVGDNTEQAGRRKFDGDVQEPSGPVPGGGSVTRTRDGDGPEADGGAELAQFLRAADGLRERIRWHEQQAAGHRAAVAGVEEVLARHGFRLKTLRESPQGGGVAAGEELQQGHDRAPMPR